jgi:hypothetical protein
VATKKVRARDLEPGMVCHRGDMEETLLAKWEPDVCPDRIGLAWEDHDGFRYIAGVGVEQAYPILVPEPSVADLQARIDSQAERIHRLEVARNTAEIKLERYKAAVREMDRYTTHAPVHSILREHGIDLTELEAK